MTVEVRAAAVGERGILENLLELYAYDFSEWMAIDLDPVTGRYGYPALGSYWSEAGRHPYLVCVDGALAGFALVQRGSAQAWDMAEFFILKRYRRQGVGAEAARRVFAMHPGRWEVRVMQVNERGLAFWRKAIPGVEPELCSAGRNSGTCFCLWLRRVEERERERESDGTAGIRKIGMFLPGTQERYGRAAALRLG